MCGALAMQRSPSGRSPSGHTKGQIRLSISRKVLIASGVKSSGILIELNLAKVCEAIRVASSNSRIVHRAAEQPTRFSSNCSEPYEFMRIDRDHKRGFCGLCFMRRYPRFSVLAQRAVAYCATNRLSAAWSVVSLRTCQMASSGPGVTGLAAGAAKGDFR